MRSLLIANISHRQRYRKNAKGLKIFDTTATQLGLKIGFKTTFSWRLIQQIRHTFPVVKGGVFCKINTYFKTGSPDGFNAFDNAVEWQLIVRQKQFDGLI